MTLFEAAAAWLLTYLIHSTALLLGALLLTRWMRNPAVREVAWRTAVVGGLVTSFAPVIGVTSVAPRYLIAPPVATIAASAPAARDAAVFGKRPTAHESDRSTEAASEVPGAANPTTGAPTAGPAEPNADGTEGGQRTAQPASGWFAGLSRLGPATLASRLFVAVWLIGAFGLVLVFARRRADLARRLGPRPRLEPHPLYESLAALKRRFGIARPIVLTVSERLASPVAVGIDEVCVPRIALEELDDAEREGMLAHEVAHLLRFDTVWLFTVAMIERVFFFQPLNRLATRRLQADAELLCDEWAAGATGSGLSVARCLVRVAEWIDAAPRPIPVAGMAEERSALVERVQRLVEELPMSAKPHRGLAAAAVLAVVLGTVMVAPSVSLAGQNRQPTTPNVRNPASAAPTEANDPNPAGAANPSVSPADELAQGRDPQATPSGAALADPTVDPAPSPDPVPGARTAEPQDTSSAVIAALSAALRDDNVGVRRAAAQSLGNLGDRRALNALLAAVADADDEVRASVVGALGELEDLRATDALLSRSRDASVEVRRRAVQGLAQFDDETAKAEWFRPWLGDEDAEVRATAARSLGDVRDRSSLGGLMKLVDDPSTDVREAAIGALGDIRDPAALPAIQRAIGDRDAEVRQRALHAMSDFELTSLPAGVLQAFKDRDADVRSAAARVAGQAHDPVAVPGLRALLADPDPDVRDAAVDGLAEIRDQSAIAALVEAMKSSDPSVRKAAARALGQRGER
ncbi:MAG: HEAT repeat domain-containing protein [Gemmatimonadales bacterium]